MKNLTPEQEQIKEAVLGDILQALLQQNALTPFLLRSRQIVSIFRVSPQRLCWMRENGQVPVVKEGRSFLYNPMDIFGLLTDQTLN